MVARPNECCTMYPQSGLRCERMPHRSLSTTTRFTRPLKCKTMISQYMGSDRQESNNSQDPRAYNRGPGKIFLKEQEHSVWCTAIKSSRKGGSSIRELLGMLTFIVAARHWSKISQRGNMGTIQERFSGFGYLGQQHVVLLRHLQY